MKIVCDESSLAKIRKPYRGVVNDNKEINAEQNQSKNSLYAQEEFELSKGKGRNVILRHAAEIVRLRIQLGFNTQYEERKFQSQENHMEVARIS